MRRLLLQRARRVSEMKKRIVMFFVTAIVAVCARADSYSWTDPATDCTWLYTVRGGTAEITGGGFVSTGEVFIPDTLDGWTVTSIGDNAFYGYSGMKSVTIPDSVTSIGVYAFQNCSSLTKVTIGKGLKTVGDFAFTGCKALKGVYITDLAAWCNISFEWNWFSILGERPSNPLVYAHKLYLNGSLIKDLIIPDGVKSIGKYAFWGCSELTSVTIPDSVKSIGEFAFQDCKKIKAVYITDVANWCGISFGGTGSNPLAYARKLYVDGSSRITKLFIPKGVDSIGYSAFAYCTNITSIVIPDSVKSIGSYAFYKCSGLTSVYITDLAKWCGISFEDSSANPLGEAHKLYLNGSLVTDLTIPDSVTRIGSRAFFCCTGLTSVTIPNSVTNIGEDAFYFCDNVRSVAIPQCVCDNGVAPHFSDWKITNVVVAAGVTNISNNAFKGCDNLVSLTIPDSVVSIGTDAFTACSNLTDVTVYVSQYCRSIAAVSAFPSVYRSVKKAIIVDGVNSIGGGAFAYCYGLTSVTIPDSVTSIGSEAFYKCTGLTSVTIPDSVTSIGDSAFYNCSGLVCVTIPDSVTSIGNNAFYKCIGLTSVTIGNSVMSIGGSAFAGCSGLTSVTIPNSVASIGRFAFSDCSGLTSVTIPDSVTIIGDYAFTGCSGLVNVTIGKSVTSIGELAFCDCSRLMSVVMRGDCPSVAHVSGFPFYGADSSCVAYLPFGNSTYASVGPSWWGLSVAYYVTVIFDANGGIGGKTTIQVPDAVLAAPTVFRKGYTFLGWEPSVPMDVPAGNVTYTAQWAESSLPSVGDPAPVWMIDSAGNLTGVDLNGCTDIIIPSNITSIGPYAFYNCSELTSVTIPNSVTNIGNYAFYNCRGLTSVTIPDSVTSIGRCAFDACSGLEEITLPFIGLRRGDTYGEDAVFGCIFGTSPFVGGAIARQDWSPYITTTTYVPSKLRNVVVTDQTVFGYGTFSGCANLARVTIPDGVTGINAKLFSGCSGLTSVTIPDSVTSIGDAAFYGCSNLASVGISGGVTNIGASAFRDCASLTSVAIPDGVTNIDSSTFSGCSGLTSISIPNSVTNIGKSAFSGCSGLTSISIPNSVMSIGSNAFAGCGGLDEITLPFVGSCRGNTEGPDSIFGYIFGGASYIGGTLTRQFYFSLGATSPRYCHYCIPSKLRTVVISDETSLSCGAFSACSALTSIVIPESVMSIGESVFDGCSGLLSVTLPQYVCSGRLSQLLSGVYQSIKNVVILDGVTSIGSYVFSGCSQLASVTIPNSVTNIGDSAFYGCGNLTSVTIPNGVTSIGVGAFYNCSELTSVTLPDSVTSIGVNAFHNCVGLKDVTIPLGMTEIESKLFLGCGGITNVMIPNGVTNIGVSAFSGCSALTSVYVLPGDADRVRGLMERSGLDLSGVSFTDVARIVFDVNDGSADVIGRYVALDCTIGELPVPTRVGHTFDGWWTSASGGAQISSSTKVTGNVTYFAHWTVDQYTVTFDANGGTGGKSVTQDYGTALAAPTVTRTGYSFKGWLPTVPSMVQTGNVTYTAQWQINRYTVTFDANGGAGGKSVTQDYGSAIVAPTVRRDGHAFAGWQPALVETFLTSNVTYTAQWTVNHYTVTFDTNGGSLGAVSSTATIAYGMAVGALPMPTREGCIFSGWWTTPNGGMKVSDMTIVTGNVTYYAHWIEGEEFSSSTIYCVIDLSAGADAANYPVAYMAAPPSGGFNTDEYKTTKLVLRLIEPGAFKMCGEYDVVLTKPFYCGIFEVTQKQYELVTGSNPSSYKGAMRPVENVSWNTIRGNSLTNNWPSSSEVDLSTFIGKIQARTGLNLDLPTEAQWEYACRAGTTSKYNNGGNEESDLKQLGRYKGNQSDGKGGYAQHTTVGSYLPNEWGLYDMHGNVYEWCLDWYGSLADGVTDPEGPSSASKRVERGGGYNSYSDKCVSSNRISDSPTTVYADLGFRLFRTGTVSYGIVTFDVNDGSIGATNAIRLVAPNMAVGTLPSPTREGCEFKGWWTSASGGTQISDSTVVSSNVTYYAHWAVSQYTVTFDANGGEGGKTVTQDYGTSLTAPTVTRTGYAFAGWSPSVPATMPMGNATYMAQWKVNQYAVVFDANGGDGGWSRSMDYGAAITAPTVTRTGYTFTGWSPSVAGTVPVGGATYTAQWEVNQYTATFDANGGEGGTTVTQDYGTALNAPTMTRTGYTFAGWSPTVPATMPAENKTYTAQWTPKKVTVALNTNGGTLGAPGGGSAPGGGTLTANAWKLLSEDSDGMEEYQSASIGNSASTSMFLTLTGPCHFTFSWKVSSEKYWDCLRWYLDNEEMANISGTGGTWQNEAVSVPAGEHTIKWTYSKDRMLTYGSDCGWVRVPKIMFLVSVVVHGQVIGALPTPTRTGYSFAGWWTAASGGTPITASTTVTANVTYYAHWTMNQYTATFDANGGEGGKSVTQDYGTALAAPTVTRAGYVFTGWSPTVPATMPAGNATYIALWRLENYSIGYELNGGTNAAGNPSIYTVEDEVSLLAPTRSGYVFEGWTPTGGKIAKGSTGNRTFTASWKQISGGGGGSDSVTPDPVTPDPVTPNPVTPDPVSPEPVTPDPVTPDPVKPDPVTPVVSTFTVTFNANGGSVSATSRKVDEGKAVGALPTPTRSGYTFDGWFTAANGGTKIGAATKVSGNVTYYAHWTVITVNYGGIVEDVLFSKAQTAVGALYDATGNLVGTVELKFGKMGKKGVKVSASATIISGGKVKKVGAKAMTLADGELRKTLAFKAPIGDMELALNADGSFTLKNGAYEMVGAVKEGNKPLRQVGIGGALVKSQMKFNVEMDTVPDFGKDGTLLVAALPVDEPVYVAGGLRWSFDKAASLKYKKNRATGAYELLGLDDPKKPNLSSLKLSYTAKTGQFKGTFKLYATNEATTPAGKSPKLKAYTVNVIGFVVDGVGYGSATLKKPAAAWSVTVK